MEQKKQLTLQEAIEQGYTHYLDNGEIARELDEIDTEEDGWEEEFPDGADLLKSQAIQTVNVTPDYIKNLLSDTITENAYEIVNDDLADRIYNHLMKMDCTGIANQINEYCSKFKHYETANAILIK